MATDKKHNLPKRQIIKNLDEPKQNWFKDLLTKWKRQFTKNIDQRKCVSINSTTKPILKIDTNLSDLFLIIGLQNIWRRNQPALQLFCNLDKFESAWMLARIASTATHRKATNVSLFWWKTINPIFDTIFSPTFFNLENIVFVRLVYHDRSLSDAFAQCGICLCSCICISAKRLTVCVSGVWVGVDSVRERKKLKARKMLENRAESHTSTARFVRRILWTPDSLTVKDLLAKRLTRLLHETLISATTKKTQTNKNAGDAKTKHKRTRTKCFRNPT